MEILKTKMLQKEPKEFFDKKLKLHSVLRFIKEGDYIYGTMYVEKYSLKMKIEESEKEAMEYIGDVLIFDLANENKKCLAPVVFDKSLKEIDLFKDYKEGSILGKCIDN